MRPCEQHAELYAENRHDRDQPVLQYMFVNDVAFAKPFGTRRADVVLAKFFDNT